MPYNFECICCRLALFPPCPYHWDEAEQKAWEEWIRQEDEGGSGSGS